MYWHSVLAVCDAGRPASSRGALQALQAAGAEAARAKYVHVARDAVLRPLHAEDAAPVEAPPLPARSPALACLVFESKQRPRGAACGRSCGGCKAALYKRVRGYLSRYGIR